MTAVAAAAAAGHRAVGKEPQTYIFRLRASSRRVTTGLILNA